MTSKREDHDIDDAALDAFLRGEDALSALLAEVDQPEVPAALAARIHADARAALREPLGAANDAHADARTDAPSVTRTPAHAGPFLRRWRGPLGLAATVVLGVSLGVRWDGWREETPRTVSDIAPPAPAMKSDAGLAAPTPSPDAPHLEDRHATPAAAPPPARVAQPTTPREQAATIATSDAAPPPPPLPVPALPSPSTDALTTMHRARRAAPPLMPDFAPPAPAPAVSAPRMLDAAPSPPATPAPALGRMAAPAPAATPAPPAADAPQAGLAAIADLLDHGDVAGARAAWTRFHAVYPDYPVPAPLQARIDALASAPGPDGR